MVNILIWGGEFWLYWRSIWFVQNELSRKLNSCIDFYLLKMILSFIRVQYKETKCRVEHWNKKWYFMHNRLVKILTSGCLSSTTSHLLLCQLSTIVFKIVVNGGRICCNPWITCNKKTIFHGNEKNGAKGLTSLSPLKQISDKSHVLKTRIHKAI